MTATTATKATTKPEPAEEPRKYATELTSIEMTESLTGYDELKIEAKLGKPVEDIQGNYTLIRAMAAIHLMRGGTKEGIAWGKAMDMPASELKRYFTPIPKTEEMDPGASEPGKDAPTS